ncbi:hypothetical protein [Streptomyces genisteinicus]|uniref:Uncharacterized protein n=1 Tax=Streptomyces genisteinicus TaxID=2768068 RepID=A0A7H0HLX5_9ACTN|nr:hypothetical protein [Streptomyces genisteinicus]QNP61541.1 hypothetical protein IAG43_00455 [Streptomyces genisteinicus]
MADERAVNGGEQAPGYPGVVEPLLDTELRMLVRLVDRDDENRSHFGVSLNIPGGVIYGQVISRDAYALEWEASLRGLPGAGAESLARIPRVINEVLEEQRDDRDDDPLPRWVHLRDATFLTGSTAQTMRYGLWRGRLADVVGWSLSIPS